MNAAMEILASRLANIEERVVRAKQEKDRCGEHYGKASDHYKALVREEMELNTALEVLDSAAAEGVISS